MQFKAFLLLEVTRSAEIDAIEDALRSFNPTNDGEQQTKIELLKMIEDLPSVPSDKLLQRVTRKLWNEITFVLNRSIKLRDGDFVIESAASQAEKKRPPKTLWYEKYENWAADIRSRFSDAEAHHNESSNHVVATCKDKKQCFGIWFIEANRGITYNIPRNIHNSVYPKDKLVKLKDPDLSRPVQVKF